MQASDARNFFQTEASLAQGRARAAKAQRTARGAPYGRPIWLGANDGTGKAGPGRAETAAGVALSAEDVGTDAVDAAIADQLAQAVLGHQDAGDAEAPRFVSAAGKDESAGAAFDGGKTRVLGALLDPTPDGGNAHLITAESGALLRRVDLESGLAVQLFRGHTAPVTALAVLDCSGSGVQRSSPTERRRVLISAGWDRSIRVWPLYDAGGSANALPARINSVLTHADAASDFIKALLVVPSSQNPVLLSGGSDRTIRIWCLRRLQQAVQSLESAAWNNPTAAGDAIAQSLASGGEKSQLDLLGVFGEHTRPLTALAMLPPRPGLQEGTDRADRPLIFSADSLGRVAQSELEVKSSGSAKATARLRPVRELKGNDTSISAIQAGWVRLEAEAGHDGNDDEPVEDAWEARVWTASRDKSAYAYTIFDAPGSSSTKRSSPAVKITKTSSNRALQFGIKESLWPERTVLHLDYVTAVLDLNMVFGKPHAGPSTAHVSVADLVQAQAAGDELQAASLVTACSDEQLRVWTLPSDARTHNAEEDDEDVGQRDGSVKVFDVHGNAAASRHRSTGALSRGEVEGHWHEISFVGVWWRQPDSHADDTGRPSSMAQQGRWWLVSASYDGSVRRWSLEEFVRLAAAFKTTPVSEQPAASTQQEGAAEGVTGARQPGATAGAGVQLTAEEEAELAELMDSDDE